MKLLNVKHQQVSHNIKKGNSKHFGTCIRVWLIEMLQYDFPYFHLSMLLNIIQKYKVNTLELAFYVLILFRSIMLIVLLYG